MTTCFVRSATGTIGPFTVEELSKMLDAKSLSPATSCRIVGSDAWTTVSKAIASRTVSIPEEVPKLDAKEERAAPAAGAMLGLLCAAIIVYGLFWSKNTEADVAMLAASTLPATLLAWLIFFATLGRKLTTRNRVFSFFGIWLCMIASAWCGYYRNRPEAAPAQPEVRLILPQFSLEPVPRILPEPVGKPDIVTAAPPTAPTANTLMPRAEVNEYERFLRDFQGRLESEREAYLRDLDAAGWNILLEPKRLNADVSFAGSNRIIRDARSLAAKYSSHTPLIFAATRESISSLRLSDADKERLRTGFDRGMGKAQEDVDRLWVLDNAMIDNMEQTATFLAAKRGEWFVQNDGLLFNTDSQVAQFESYREREKELEAEREEIRKKGASAAGRILEIAKKMKSGS